MAEPRIDPGAVSVRGIASVPGRPDRVEVALTVSVVEPSPQAAMSETTRRADELTAVLDGLTISRDSWSTSGVGLYEQREWDGKRQVHRGYRGTYRVSVRLTEHVLLGQLLREAIERAGAQVAGPWWRIDPDNPARLEACRRAAANARNKAQAYADALGARLGAPGGVMEPEVRVGGAEFSYTPLAATRAMAAGGSPEMDVQPGELDVTASVDVAFRLEPTG